MEIVGMDAAGLLARASRCVAEVFEGLKARYPSAPARLMESIQYSLMAGGKRLRPALVVESAAACGESGKGGAGTTAGGEPNASVRAAAAAMELIHTFSLVHDDLPAMDDDDLRRGQPTNHKVFGEAMAILAGDAMTTIAFDLLATDADPAVAPALVAELARASGPGGMIGGQVIDMSERKPATVAELRHLHAMKTGALLTASCRMGAIAAVAAAAELAAVTAYGERVGLAFQIVDDILDQTSTAAELGKATNKDAAKGKMTYPMLLGLDASRREAKQQLQGALDAVASLGGRAEPLRVLARFIVERNV